VRITLGATEPVDDAVWGAFAGLGTVVVELVTTGGLLSNGLVSSGRLSIVPDRIGVLCVSGVTGAGVTAGAAITTGGAGGLIAVEVVPGPVLLTIGAGVLVVQPIAPRQSKATTPIADAFWGNDLIFMAQLSRIFKLLPSARL
jgi:hypothetical protein